jgi:hypothetical protein
MTATAGAGFSGIVDKIRFETALVIGIEEQGVPRHRAEGVNSLGEGLICGR